MPQTPQHAEFRSFICPHCDKPATAVIRGSAVWSGHNEMSEQINPPVEYSLVQCDRCAEVSVQAREDYGQGFEDDEPVIVYPARRRLSLDIPEKLRQEWEEAQTCFDAKAYKAAVVMVRRTLEGTCREQGLTGGTLAANLRTLRDRELIDGMLAEGADALRLIGNVGAHFTGTTVSREDATDALDFAEALLDHLYVLRRRFSDFKSRIEKRKQASA